MEVEPLMPAYSYNKRTGAGLPSCQDRAPSVAHVKNGLGETGAATSPKRASKLRKNQKRTTRQAARRGTSGASLHLLLQWLRPAVKHIDPPSAALVLPCQLVCGVF